MSMECFSQRVKNSLMELEIKKKCCKRMFSIGSSFDDNSSIAIIDSITKCSSCWSSFFIGLFVSYGSITDPNKRYHLEFSFYDLKNAKEIIDRLEKQDMNFKLTQRKSKYIVYTKNSSVIEDFFAFIGANSITFDLMNIKIEREMKNSINRVVNCDTANVAKAVNASKKYIIIIDALENGRQFEKMSNDLKETALLRNKYPQATLLELAGYHNPPITKSGVIHRLKKIEEFYDSIQSKL